VNPGVEIDALESVHAEAPKIIIGLHHDGLLCCPSVSAVSKKRCVSVLFSSIMYGKLAK